MRTDPSEAESPTYKFEMQFLRGMEDVHTILKWETNIGTVFTGLNITAGGAQANIAKQALKDYALLVFKMKLNELATVAKQAAIDAATTNPQCAAVHSRALSHY